MVNKVEIEIKYSNSIKSVVEIWENNKNSFCSNCGEKGFIWSNTGPGDYYAGNLYVCIKCFASAYEPIMAIDNDEITLSIINKIKGKLE